ncbi:hypothetical protein Tco_0967703 [Tanacetum coccineum]
MTRLTTWKLSDPDVPRTSRQKIGMRRFGFGLIQRTWSGVLKMLKTGQRARHKPCMDPDAELRELQEYLSLIQTFFDTHTVGGVFLWDKDRRLYDIVREGGQSVGGHSRLLVECLGGKRGKDVLDVPVPRCNHTSDVNELKRSNKQLQKQIGMITKAMSSDDRMSQLFTQSSHSIETRE